MLWTLVLIAFIVAQLVGTGRVEIRIAGNLVANAVTGAAAEGAVSRAVFELIQPEPQKRWQPDGNGHSVTIGNARVEVRIFDEAGLINPNVAAPQLLTALLVVTGTEPQAAQRLTAAIGAWVGTAGAALKSPEIAAQYRGAGRDYLPPGEPMESLGELRRVAGMTPAVFAAIRPHLSLYAPAEPDPAYADPVVKKVLTALAGPQAAGAAASAPADRDTLTVRIVADARGPGGSRATRVAVVRIVRRTGTYTVLTWDDETAADDASGAEAGGV